MCCSPSGPDELLRRVAPLFGCDSRLYLFKVAASASTTIQRSAVLQGIRQRRGRITFRIFAPLITCPNFFRRTPQAGRILVDNKSARDLLPVLCLSDPHPKTTIVVENGCS